MRYSLTLAPRPMKTYYYTCHVAGHQKQPQPILGPNLHMYMQPSSVQKIQLSFGGRALSLKPQLAPLPRPTLYSSHRNNCVEAFFPKSTFMLIFHFI